MSNSETESASTTLENSVEVNIKPVNKKNNNNYSNSMKATFGNNSNAFENNSKNKNEKKNNTTPEKNSPKVEGDLDSKMNEIQPMLEKLKELKTSYESATNADKGTIEKEFETTKQKVIDLQEEINSIVAGMNVKSNTFAFFEEKYPTYMKTLKELDVVKNNSTGKVEEEKEMGSVMSNTNSNSMSVNSNQGSNTSTVTNANSQSIANNNSVNVSNNNTKNTKNTKNTNNTKKNNTNVAKNNTKKNNTGKPANNVPVPINNNYSRKTVTTGGKRRKNKSRKANKRR